ncbi:MAG TPA: hypothetical protein VFQ41_01970 [Candidatus Angelobacter sp.]|nr:hypothetical protein [Candidatus Angelobacter sp.]
MPVPEWSGSDHRRYKDDKRNRIGMDSRGTDHVYGDGAAGGGAAWRVQDHLVNISEVNKRGELFSSYEARRVETAIPGNNGPNSKLAPLTVRGNEVDEPAARATIVGEIVLIEGGGGGAGVIGMLPLHPPLTSQMAAKAKARTTKFDNFSTWNSQMIVTRITADMDAKRS